MPRRIQNKSKEGSMLFSILILIIFVGLVLYDAFSMQLYYSTVSNLGSAPYLMVLAVLCLIGLVAIAFAVRHLSMLYPKEYNAYHYAVAGFSLELIAFVFLIFTKLKGFTGTQTLGLFLLSGVLASLLYWRTLHIVYTENK